MTSAARQARYRAKAARTISVPLSEQASRALDAIKARYGLTIRDSVMLALVALADGKTKGERK